LPADSTAQEKEAQEIVVPALQYNLHFDGLLNFGNVNRYLLNQRLKVRYQGGQLFWLECSPYFAYGKTNGILAEREAGASLHATALYQKPVYGLLFTATELSNLRGIDARWMLGLGIGYHYGYRAEAQQRFKLSLSNAFIGEETRFNEGSSTRVLRNSSRLMTELHLIGDKLQIFQTTFFQPALNQKNLRWSNSIDLRVPVHRVLSFHVHLLSTYESVTVPGRFSYDHRLSFGFTLSNWQ
jgi:hypothetical protein